MTTLQKRIDALKASSADKMTPEIVEALKAGFQELNERQVLDKALQVGDQAPAFVLPDSRGVAVSSGKLLAAGPLVITFYRGKW
jgi:hypothetical protein